jgi:hypothetical protein
VRRDQKSSGSRSVGDGTSSTISLFYTSDTPLSEETPIGTQFIPYLILQAMRISSLAALVAAAWTGAVSAHNIQLKAHSRECFHEELHRDDKMTVTFQVGDREFGGSGNLDIDFYVSKRLASTRIPS